MIVLDTHAWIWWNSSPSLLSTKAAGAIDKASTVGICPISCWEISAKVAKGNLHLNLELDAWIREAFNRPKVQLIPISAEIAVRAGQLGRDGFHGDPADRMITATAIVLELSLVTKDAKIQSSKLVNTIW